MRNPLFIFLTILGALCACACIVLIAVIILNGNNRANDAANDTAIPVPERFRQLADTAVPAQDSLEEPPPSAAQPPEPPRYIGTLTCGTKVPADTLKQLLVRQNLFCQKSQWSKQWANPSGKGIRLRREGLAFTDSMVTDSLSRRIWQRHSTHPKLTYHEIDNAIAKLNSSSWQGFRDWRAPTVEELMVLLTPGKNRNGLHLPGLWNNRSRDFWSCNPAADSLSLNWIWVVRTGFGRCNYGHPDTPRALLAVREY